MTRRTRDVARPLQRFLATEAGGAALLLAATVVAMVWANSPVSGSYDDLWHTEIAVNVGDWSISEDLRHWINDGLMVFFFFLVGMEVRRELSMGELTDRRRALVPALAALGGMVVPALLYLAVNAGGEGAGGWGIAMATDIAFVVGLLALVAPNAPSSLRVFLLTLAIVDDIGAIVVIAIFYSSGIDVLALAVAVAVLPVIVLINRIRAWRGPAYMTAGLVLWVAMFKSGIHPTIAGVILGAMVAVHPPRRRDVELATRLTRLFRQEPTPELARVATLSVTDAVSPNERLQALWHPWTSYVIVPLFALANAGVALNADMLSDAAGSAITLGIVVGLVAGKLIGVAGTTVMAARSGVGKPPEGVSRTELAGGAALAGIGFTIALFITDLAFEDEALQEQAKVGVLVASIMAAGLATVIFWGASRRAPARDQAGAQVRLAHAVRDDLDHIRGPADAPLTLLEYGDYECPHCHTARAVVEEVRAQLGDELRFVWRHLPVEAEHDGARLAAEGAEAADAQGHFWPMHDRLIAAGKPVDLSGLIDEAQAVGLDLDRFVDDVQEHAYAGRIDLNVRGADESHAEGTPTFFVNDVRYDGPLEAQSLIQALRGAPNQG